LRELITAEVEKEIKRKEKDPDEQPKKIEEAKVSVEANQQNSEPAVLPNTEENKGNFDKEKKVRCRKWPTCNDEECKFHHPTEPCPYFPKCKFKDKCLYIHPNVWLNR